MARRISVSTVVLRFAAIVDSSLPIYLARINLRLLPRGDPHVLAQGKIDVRDMEIHS